MLITVNIHQLLAETAMAASVSPWPKFVQSDERRSYDLALAERCAR